jgi:methionyl-tRNA formyltransferase
MKIVAIGTSKFLISCVTGLTNAGHEIICLISQPEVCLPVNSVDVKKYAELLGAKYFEVEDINSDMSMKYLKELKPDIIFSAWPKLIKKEILSIPKYCVIGSHPTSLPCNRGRHPLHWQLVLKIKESLLSFFMMDEGVDSGPILLQKPYSIELNDNIKSLNDKLDQLAPKAAEELGELLHIKPFPSGQVQDHSVSNVWRKRTLYDVTIDFRMQGGDIISLVKSFSEPFSHAMICTENSMLYVVDARVNSEEIYSNNLTNIEPGKILYSEKKVLKVKVADCIVDFVLLNKLDKDFYTKSYLHPPAKYIIENPSLKKYFRQ